MAKQRRKPPAPLRPFYDEDGYCKTNPYLDRLMEYERFVVHPLQAIEQKGKWRELAGNRPLFLEIGTGLGHFLTEQAARWPEHFFVGIELKFKRLFKTAKRIEQMGLENIRLLRFDANYPQWLFDPNELDGLFLFFPDPWSKRKRYLYRRMVTEEFVRHMAEILKPGAKVEFKTDHLEYFEETAVFFEAPPFRILRRTHDWQNSEWGEELPQTLFEKTFRQRGIHSRYLQAEKQP